MPEIELTTPLRTRRRPRRAGVVLGAALAVVGAGSVVAAVAPPTRDSAAPDTSYAYIPPAPQVRPTADTPAPPDRERRRPESRRTEAAPDGDPAVEEDPGPSAEPEPTASPEPSPPAAEEEPKDATRDPVDRSAPDPGRVSGLLTPAELLVLEALGTVAPGLVPIADEVVAATNGLLDRAEDGLGLPGVRPDQDVPDDLPVKQGSRR